MKKLLKERLLLNAANIDLISEYLETHGKAVNCEPKNMLRVRLAVENVLLQWLDALPAPGKLTVSLIRKSTELVLELRLAGPKLDPFADPEEGGESNDLQSWLNHFIDDISYQYYDNVNILLAAVPRKGMSGLKIMLLAMVAGLLSGLACKAMGAEAIATATAIVGPIYKAMLGLLVGLMGPMIFLSVLMGVVRIGDPKSLSTIGHKIFKNMLFFTLGSTVLIAATFSWYVPSFQAGQGSGNLCGRLFGLLLQIVPGNIAVPFVKGDFLQIVLLALAFGVAFIYMSEKMQPLLNMLQLLEDYFIKLMLYFCRYLQYLIYFALFNVAMATDAKMFASLGIYFVSTAMALVVLFAAQLLLLYVKVGIGPLRFWRAMRQPLMVGLTTASSLAAFTELQQSCVRLGVNKNFAGLALSLGQTLYKNGATLCFVGLGVIGASSAGLPLGLGDIGFITVAGLIITLAVAPAGGGMAAFIMFFNFLEIKDPVLSIAMTALIFIDYPCTLANVLCNGVLCLCTARDLGKLDETVLKVREPK